jgi:hypothetical protein
LESGEGSEVIISVSLGQESAECTIQKAPIAGAFFHAGIRGGAAIVGTDVQRTGPHFLIGDAMIADDADRSKLLLEGFHIGIGRSFQIHNHDVGTQFRCSVAKLVD